MTDPAVCPYCRMPFDESGPARIFCTACGMPHHEDCYQENGGCTVFGCARAPADDPKLQVSYSDLNAVPMVAPQPTQPGYAPPPSVYQAPPPTAHTPAQPLYPQPLFAASRQPRSRTTFIVLGVFLGALGVHNFYAGYTGRAVGQLCLSVLTVGYLAVVSWIWAVIEICVVQKDSAGIQFT
jgi:TM2 domain-containing membrane protein YozV